MPQDGVCPECGGEVGPSVDDFSLGHIRWGKHASPAAGVMLLAWPWCYYLPGQLAWWLGLWFFSRPIQHDTSLPVALYTYLRLALLWLMGLAIGVAAWAGYSTERVPYLVEWCAGAFVWSSVVLVGRTFLRAIRGRKAVPWWIRGHIHSIELLAALALAAALMRAYVVVTGGQRDYLQFAGLGQLLPLVLAWVLLGVLMFRIHRRLQFEWTVGRDRRHWQKLPGATYERTPR